MRAALVLLLCSAPASAREEPTSGRTALAVTPRGDAEPGHAAARADAPEQSARAASGRVSSYPRQDSRNAHSTVASNRSSFLDVDELAFIRSACRFAGKEDSKLLAAVLVFCLFMGLCAIVMWVTGSVSTPGEARRHHAGAPNGQRLAPPQAYAPPPSPGQLRPPGPVPHAGVPPSYAAPGPTPVWWGSGQAAPYPPAEAPIAGGAKDETVLFDTYEYRRQSRRVEENR